MRIAATDSVPYAPSRVAAPIVTLGYREAAADLFFMRLTGYYGGPESTAQGVSSLVEAVASLDPHFRKIYEWGARAMTSAPRGVDEATYLRAIRLLEEGSTVFPTDWRMPLLAGQMYFVDLTTQDPAQRRQWDEIGARLLESATRKPGAPADAAHAAAHLRTRLGQRQRAIDGLREMLLITSDLKARQHIISKLTELEKRDADAIALELLDARRSFETAWHAERPAVPPTMYVLIGRVDTPGFDLGDLAVGGRNVVDVRSTTIEPATDVTPSP